MRGTAFPGVCGPCTQAPAAKVNAGFIYRTPVNVDLSADFSFVEPDHLGGARTFADRPHADRQPGEHARPRTR